MNLLKYTVPILLLNFSLQAQNIDSLLSVLPLQTATCKRIHNKGGQPDAGGKLLFKPTRGK